MVVVGDEGTQLNKTYKCFVGDSTTIDYATIIKKYDLVYGRTKIASSEIYTYTRTNEEITLDEKNMYDVD